MLDGFACAPSVCVADCSVVTRASSGRRPLSSHTSLSHRANRSPAIVSSSDRFQPCWETWLEGLGMIKAQITGGGLLRAPAPRELIPLVPAVQRGAALS